ncbi:DUF4041 domain-containing protein [Micromonospora cremea]|uniref:DUF4041 domain-containing protein n=1 Tax=Micromonospora cremea TaxID=709881 RepID=UPI001FCC4D4D|nr:DUF4041 domain-containing protein [Micromonospora cremea]
MAAENGELQKKLTAWHAEATKLQGQLNQRQGELTQLRGEHDRLQSEMRRLGQMAAFELEQYRDRLTQQTAELEQRVGALSQQVVVTEETVLLQEVGVYEYRHPLTDAVAYQGKLATFQDRIKAMAMKDGGAVQADTRWTVSGSEAKGRAMIRDYSKLVLRAYNAEADNLVRGLKPYKVDSAIERLNKVAETIARLGKSMDIQISNDYHRLRRKELELTADYLAKVAEEKEREREEKARLREERKVQQEIERERARLEKERQHYANALAALRAKGDAEGVAQMEERLAEVEAAAEAVDYRAANVRAGYVYVISNIGAFGEHMVKIGMTRRLDPLDRVRELSDASVPFNFDVHALFFSEDAVGIETQMHARLADRRVNLVNQRREFFHVTPQEAKTHLLALTGNLLQYDEVPEALEYRQSVTSARVEPVSGTSSATPGDGPNA